MVVPNRPGHGEFWRLRLVGVLLVTLFLWYFVGKVDRTLFRLGVRTVEAVYGTVETRYEGRAVLLRHEHVVSAPAPGRVTLLVGEGRHVRTGDIVIEVNDVGEIGQPARELEAINRRLAQAGNAFDAERSRLVQRREDVEKRLADARKVLGDALAQGESQLAREAESRHDAFQRELSEIDQALTDLARREEKEREELLLQRQSLLALRPTDVALVRSPSSGLVSFSLDGLEAEAVPGAELLQLFETPRRSERRVQDGVRVGRGDPLFRLVETDRLEVAVRVRGAALDTGSRVILDFHGIPERSFTGRLEESFAVDGEFLGRVRLDAFDSSLVHRRMTDVVLTTERRQGIVVPATALVEQNGKKGVYLMLGDRSVFREVRVLGGNERQVVIDGVSGVPVGARVVINPRRLRRAE